MTAATLPSLRRQPWTASPMPPRRRGGTRTQGNGEDGKTVVHQHTAQSKITSHTTEPTRRRGLCAAKNSASN